jgi:hypothetical protein
MKSDDSFILGLDRLSALIQALPFYDEPPTIKVWVRMMARVAERRRAEEAQQPVYPEDVEMRRKAWEQTRAKAEYDRAKREVEARKRAEEMQMAEEKRKYEDEREQKLSRLREDFYITDEAQLREEMLRMEEERRQGEDRRLEEEALRLEEELRIKEEERLAEENRLEEALNLAEERFLERQERLEEERRLESERLAEESQKVVTFGANAPATPPHVPAERAPAEHVAEEKREVVFTEPPTSGVKKRKDKRKNRAEKKAQRLHEPFIDPNAFTEPTDAPPAAFTEPPNTLRDAVLKEAVHRDQTLYASRKEVMASVSAGATATEALGVTVSPETDEWLKEESETFVKDDAWLREQAEKNIGNRLPPADSGRRQLFKPAMIAAVMFVLSVSAGFMGLRFFFAENRTHVAQELSSDIGRTPSGTEFIAYGGDVATLPADVKNAGDQPATPADRGHSNVERTEGGKTAATLEDAKSDAQESSLRAEELSRIAAQSRAEEEQVSAVRRAKANAERKEALLAAHAAASQNTGATVVREEAIDRDDAMPARVTPSASPATRQPLEGQRQNRASPEDVAMVSQPSSHEMSTARAPIPRLFPILGTSWHDAISTLIPSSTSMSSKIRVRVSVRDKESPETMKAVLQIQNALSENMTLLVEQDNYVPVGYVRMLALMP